MTIQVIICEDLGRPALLVKTAEPPTLLLLDRELDHDERMEIMERFIDPVADD